MNRKSKLYLGASVLLLAATIYYIGFVTSQRQVSVNLPYTILKAGEQLNSAGNLAKWYLPFAADPASTQTTNGNRNLQSGDYSVSILDRSSASVVLQSSFKDQSKQFVFNAEPDSADDNSSRLTLTYRSTLFNQWFGRNELEKNAEESLENLKTYMEDTRQFYGYQIEQTTVTDSLFLFKSATVPLAQKREATKNLFDDLIRFAETINADYTGTRIFYTTAYGKDQVMLFASIGVNNKLRLPEESAIRYKSMPFGKNLLVATYQGPYGEVSKVYTALENFKADHKLSSMAIPFQKFLNEGYDFADDQVVQMKVYYPIF